MDKHANPRIRIPQSAIEELEMVEQADWSVGIPLEVLLEWINDVAARFRPQEIDESARAGQEFTARTLRHYQTLGCIAPPRRQGKRAHYEFRHYLQALVLRKLLWERLPSEQIVRLMSGRSIEEYKQLLFEGIEIVPRRTASKDQAGGRQPTPSGPHVWTRHELADGIELALRRGRATLTQRQADQLMTAIRSLLVTAD